MCLEQAIVAGRQSSSEDQKFAAKPNLSQIGPYFFGNGTIFTEKKLEILMKNREGEILLNEEGKPVKKEFIYADSAAINRDLKE